MGFKKGRQYATTWLERAEDIGYWNSYRTIGGIQYRPIDCCVEALKRDPEYAEAWCKLGLQITKMGPGENTDKELTGMDLFKDEPKITDNKQLHRTQINAAVFCFDKAIEIEPKNVDAWYQKGSWYNSWLHNEEEKIECFLEVTKLDPKHKAVWFDLANAYGSSVGKAVKCYDKATALLPTDAKEKRYDEHGRYYFFDRWYGKAYLLSELGRHEEALKCYDEAIALLPRENDYRRSKLDPVEMLSLIHI